MSVKIMSGSEKARVDSSELQKQIQLGKDLSKAKEYKKAEQIFLDILREHPLADVYNSLGLSYENSGDFKAAEFAFKKALEINPHYMEAALNLSVLYNNLGFGKKSGDLYRMLKKYGASGRGAMDPLLMSKIANLYKEVGDLYHGVGEYKSAIVAYEEALDLCPNFLDIQTKLAIALRETGNHKRALKIFEKSRARAGKFAPFWVALGVTYYATNEPEKARASGTKALEIEPGNLSAKSYLRLKLQEPAKKSAKKMKKK